jgi:hypothetical protein
LNADTVYTRRSPYTRGSGFTVVSLDE